MLPVCSLNRLSDVFLLKWQDDFISFSKVILKEQKKQIIQNPNNIKSPVGSDSSADGYLGLAQTPPAEAQLCQLPPSLRLILLSCAGSSFFFCVVVVVSSNL